MGLLYRISLKALIYNDAGQILIEYGKISSKDELTKIDIRSLVENIVGVGVEIVFYGAKVQVRRDLDDSILEKTMRFSDVARRLAYLFLRRIMIAI